MLVYYDSQFNKFNFDIGFRYLQFNWNAILKLHMKHP